MRDHFTFCNPHPELAPDRIFRLLREVDWFPTYGYGTGYDATSGDDFNNETIQGSYAYGDARARVIKTDPKVLEAYRKARSARFEHGECG